MLLLVDFLNVAYRSFHAIRELKTSDGRPTNAVYGFIQSVRRWNEELKPSHLAVVMDAETPRRRLQLLADYKANRPPTPEALISQLKELTHLFPLLGWPVAYHPEHEADDLAAAIALEAAREGQEVRIASNDKDFFQILNPRIKVLRSTPKETVVVDQDWLREHWGLESCQVADYLALTGDASDNIPGVKGVGEKTALALIKQFGSVDELLRRCSEVEKPRIREQVAASEGCVRRNMELIRLCPVPDLPLFENFRLKPPQCQPLLAALAKLELKSLHARYEKEAQEASDGRQMYLF
ncbi:MAG: 5'-3' exonuclease [Verrucomicrobiae bacterium]|nr:5'-3' exonuclease [Verrucomicrobiae bacterium]